jgi:hypothetical protein
MTGCQRQFCGRQFAPSVPMPITVPHWLWWRPILIMSPPDPIEAILFRMEQHGLKPKDLEPMIGQRNRVCEVLNGKRKLTMAMVWRLHTGLGIPAESLIRQPS